MQYKKVLSILFGIIFSTVSISFSQEGIIKKYHLTHDLSPAEKELMKTNSRSFYETTPPTGEVRNIAEWEPMESVLIAYDYGFGIPYSLIAEMSEDCNVTTIVSGQSEENIVRNYYSSNGVNLSNCNFVYQDPNSYWTRDYSPWYIAIDDSEVAIVNFPYNRPRPNDNDVPILMADSLNVDLYGMDVMHTGGNYMCDGYGIAASTDLVWEEESQTPEQINTKMLNYLGIETYHVTADPLDDYIKHIDCWGKFLDVDKILLTQVPETDYRYNNYEALATYFSEQNCSWGYPYEVIRVQAADNSENDINPYSNSLILNDKVFVPQTGSSLDDEAIATYEAAMPGYEIIGVYSSGWYNTDALHCRTHGVADREMLYIKHYPLHGELAFETNFTIEADVVSYGGSLISTDFPKLFYRNTGGTWVETDMTNTGGNTYSSSIPGLEGNNEIEYYIYAENDNNKSESHPQIGSADPHTFSYSGSNVLIGFTPEICVGSSIGTLTLTNTIGTISDWEKRLDNGAWESIGHTNDTHSEIPTESGTWEYRVEIDGTHYSSIVSVIVFEMPVSEYNYIANNQTITFNNISSGATNYLWNFGDGNSTTTENPVYTYSASGSYSVVLSASNTVCSDDIFSEEISVSFVGITQLESNINISPNPTSGKFKIETSFDSGTIQIMNLNGQTLYSGILNSKSNMIDISEYAAGIYLIKIENKELVTFEKIIIK